MIEDRQGISAGEFGFHPYHDAQPREHSKVCFSAAIGRNSRGGRSHTLDFEIIIRDALQELVARPESCICRSRKRRR